MNKCVAGFQLFGGTCYHLQPGVCDSNGIDCIAYCGKVAVYFLAPTGRYLGFLPVKSGPMALRFCPDDNDKLAVITDGQILYVSVTSGILIKADARDPHLEKEKTKLMCVDFWMKGDSIFAGTDRGRMIRWQYPENKLLFDQPSTETSAITALRICPHEQDYVAIGYKSGSLIVYDLSSDTVRNKFNLHDGVSCVVWSPRFAPDSNIVGDQKPQSYYLASGCADGYVCVWSLDEIGRGREPAAFFYASTDVEDRRGGGRSNNRNATKSKNRFYVPIVWGDFAPFQLITCSSKNEIICYDLKDRSHRRAWFKDSPHRKSPIYSLVAGRDSEGRQVIMAFSCDRTMSIWDWQQQRLTCYIKSSVVNSPNCLQFKHSTKADAKKLAIAVGYPSPLLIWNVDSDRPYDIVDYFWAPPERKNAQLLSVCWHPVHDNVVALGTSDGCVELQTLRGSDNRKLDDFMPCLNEEVWKVEFGGVYGTSSQTADYSLYASAGGKLLIFDCEHFDRQPQFINFTDEYNKEHDTQKVHMSFAWNLNFNLLALSSEDGTVEIFYYETPARNLRKVANLQVASPEGKYILVLSWHPNDPVLATASHVGLVQIFNLKDVVARAADLIEAQTVAEQLRFDYHGTRVFSLIWEPMNGDLLASGAGDESVQVYTVKDAKPLANFRGHSLHGRITGLAWSSTDPNVIFSASEQHTVLQWKVSEQCDHKVPPKQEKGLQKQQGDTDDKVMTVTNATMGDIFKASDIGATGAPFKTLKLQQQHDDNLLTNGVYHGVPLVKADNQGGHDLDDSIDSELAGSVAPGTKSRMRNTARGGVREMLNEAPLEVNHIESIVDDAELLPSNWNKKKRKSVQHKALFSHLTSSENAPTSLEDIEMLLADSQSTDSWVDAADAMRLGCYSTQSRALQAARHAASYLEAKNFNASMVINAWGNDVTIALQHAQREKKLNDFLVSLAPQASHETWQWACKCYAVQLEDSGQYQKAATYLLMLGRPNDAVTLLLKHEIFKDAAMLAKMRLAPDSPLLNEVFERWAARHIESGNIEQAVKCYMAIGRYADAAKVMNHRRADAQMLSAGHLLALRACDPSLAGQIENECIMKGCAVGDWALARAVIARDKSRSEHWQYYISCHQALMAKLQTVAALRNDTGNDTYSQQSPQNGVGRGAAADTFAKRVPVLTVNPSFLHALWHAWQDEFGTRDAEGWRKVLTELKPFITLSTSVNRQEVLTATSLWVCVGLLELVTGQPAFNSFISAMNQCSKQPSIATVKDLASLITQSGGVDTSCCSVASALQSLAANPTVILTKGVFTLEAVRADQKSASCSCLVYPQLVGDLRQLTEALQAADGDQADIDLRRSAASKLQALCESFLEAKSTCSDCKNAFEVLLRVIENKSPLKIPSGFEKGKLSDEVKAVEMNGDG